MLSKKFGAQLGVVELTGDNLTIEEVVRVAVDHVEVKLAPGLIERIHSDRDMLMKISQKDTPIYGVNRGVGANKNVQIPHEEISNYQTRILLSHSVGMGPYFSEEIVRAIMVIRANSLAKGGSGVQPEILEMYVHMLNHQIHPMTPSKGSLGAADLGPMAEMGLPFVGLGEVMYQGERMEAKDALEQAGLKPIVLGPKDGLILCSHNSASLGHAALVISKLASLLDQADLSYALALEAFRGNISPLHSKPNEYRRHLGQADCIKDITSYLKDSFLWDYKSTKGVQDPISYRSAVQVHGACRDIFHFALDGLTIEMNSMGDNPLIVHEEETLISHGNFHIQTVAMRFDFLGIQLSSLANMIQHRIQKLMTPEFSELPKFLTENPGLSNGFSTLQKSYTSLAAEIRHLANPGCLDALPVANGVEDHGSMAMYVVQKTEQIIEKLECMVGIELMVAAQAVDILKNPPLGIGTAIAYRIIRENIPYLESDRILTKDIASAHVLIQSGRIVREVQSNLKI